MTMTHLGLRTKVLLVLALALVGCLAVAGTGIFSIRVQTRVLDTLAVASDRVETLQRMDALTSDIAATEKQILLELDRPKIQALAERLRQIDTELQRLLESYRQLATGGEGEALGAMQGNLTDWRRDSEKLRTLAIAFSNDEARLVHLNSTLPKLAAFDERMKALVQKGMEMKAAVGGDARNAQALGRASVLWLAGVSLTAVLLSLVVGYLTTRSVVSGIGEVIADLDAASRQTLHASQQVNSSSQALAQGSSEQAASLEETSATLQQIAAMTRQTMEHMERMEHLVSQARENAGKGGEAMDLMVERINLIKDSSDKTAKIIKTIDEIAFQTNLLALNAAVEAARAGEAGRGFAVVAEEVRNLALRSAQAARDTSALIEESRTRAEQGVSASGDAQRLLQDIRGTVDDVSGVVRDVATAGQEQSRGVDQITHALAQLDQLTQTNAASAEQNAAASEELSAQSNSLSLVVDRLAGLVSGDAARQGLHHDPAPRLAPSAVPPPRPPERKDVRLLTAAPAPAPSRPDAPRTAARRPGAPPRAAARKPAANLRERILRDQHGSAGTPPAEESELKFRDIQG